MSARIARTRWGWSLLVDPTPAAPDGLVASADHAAELWPLARKLDLDLTA